MGYYLHHQDRPPSPGEAEEEKLCRLLETGTTQQRLGVLRRMIEMRAEAALTRCLSSMDPSAVQLAITGLWECWLDEAGSDARRILDRGVEAMHNGDLAAATATFKALMTAHPDWTEAVNKLATVLYLQGQPEESIQYCHQVVTMKPDHFGAWNGMAVCAIQIEDWALALRAVEESLRLQPHSSSNRQLMRLVLSRLRPQET